jgi:tellurite resistance protein TerC
MTAWAFESGGGMRLSILALFLVVAVPLLALDLLVLRRQAHAFVRFDGAVRSVVWVGASLLFMALIGKRSGTAVAGTYLACYLKSLAFDHLIVFITALRFFSIPDEAHHRVLFWGAVLAILLRGALFWAKDSVLESISWMNYGFAFLLLFLGVRMLRRRSVAPEPAHNPFMRHLERRVLLARGLRGYAFIVRDGGTFAATPMLLALLALESSDLFYAIDEIPGLLSITSDAPLAFAANAFGLLTLRSLYFLLRESMGRFIYLHVGVGVILVFSAIKLGASDFLAVPWWATLAFIVAVLSATKIAALLETSGRGDPGSRPPPPPSRDRS